MALTARDMNREQAHLANSVVLACINQNRFEADPKAIKEAFCSNFGIRPVDITVAKHHLKISSSRSVTVIIVIVGGK